MIATTTTTMMITVALLDSFSSDFLLLEDFFELDEESVVEASSPDPLPSFPFTYSIGSAPSFSRHELMNSR